MNPQSCPRFDKCSAPVCPLDPHWRERRHIDGEPVCAYLLEAAKNGGRPAQTPIVPGELVETLATVYPLIEASRGSIRRALKRASQSGGRLGRKPGNKKPAAVTAGKSNALTGEHERGHVQS